MFRVILILVMMTGVSQTVIASQGDKLSSFEIKVNPTIPVYPLNQKNNFAFGRYSIPTYPEYVPVDSHLESEKDEKFNSDAALTRQAPLETWSSIIAKSLVPLSSFALYVGAKAIAYTFKFTAVVLIGVALTTCICTFTPLCHITFNGIGYNKTQVTEAARPYITTENLNKGTVMIGHAIDAFKEIQGDAKRNIGLEGSRKEEVTSIVKEINSRRRRHT